MPQTSVVNPAPALVGALAYPSRPSVRGSAVNGQGGAIAFGLGVCRDGDDNTVDLPAAAADVTDGFRGVAFRDPTKEFDADGFADADQMTFVRKGYVYVTVDSAVTQGGEAFCRHTGGNEGQFRADADTANASAVPGARFASSTTAAGIAILELF